MKFTTFGAAIVVGALLFSGAASAGAAVPGEWTDPVDVSAHSDSAYGQELAVAPDGSLIAVWVWEDGPTAKRIQTSTSSDNGATWSVPIDLTDGANSAIKPQLAVSSAGLVTVVWLESNGSNRLVRTKSSDTPGTSWPTTATNLSAAGQHANDPQLAVSSDGSVTVVWKRNNGSNNIVQTMTSSASAATWPTTATDLSALGQNTYGLEVVVTPGGTVTVVWRRFDGTIEVIQTMTSSNPRVSWPAVATDLSDGTESATSPDLALSSDGSVTVVWRQYDGPDSIIQAKTSDTDGRNWPTTAIDVSATVQDASDPQVAVSSDGSVTVVWRLYDGANFIVQAKTLSAASATWPVAAIDLSDASHDGGGMQLAVGPDGSVFVVWAWSESIGTTTHIQASDSSDNGATWSASAEIASTGFTEDAVSAAISADGSLIAAWPATVGSDHSIQSSYWKSAVASTADDASAGLPATGAAVPVALVFGGMLALMLGAGVLVFSRSRAATK